MCRASLEFYCVKKRHRRITARAEFSFVFNLSLVLFIPRPERWMQLFSALRIGTDCESYLVLSKTDCLGERFRITTETTEQQEP